MPGPDKGIFFVLLKTPTTRPDRGVASFQNQPEKGKPPGPGGGWSVEISQTKDREATTRQKKGGLGGGKKKKKMEPAGGFWGSRFYDLVEERKNNGNEKIG